MTRKTDRKIDPYLTANPRFKRWHDGISESATMCDNQAGHVVRFCERHKWIGTPAKLAAIAAKGKAGRNKIEDAIEDDIRALERAGKAPGYIDQIVCAAKSWLRHEDILLVRKFKIKGRWRKPRKAVQKPLSPDDVRTIFTTARARTQIAVGSIAFSATRFEVLGNEDHTDGLRVGDLPEMKVDNATKTVTFIKKVPTLVLVRPELDKNHLGHPTFYPQEVCDAVKAELERRMASGEEITKNSPILAADARWGEAGHLNSDRISSLIRDAMRPKYAQYPYRLKSYWTQRMDIAEQDGKITREFRLLLAGHKGDIQSVYSREGELPPQTIEALRKAYEACVPYLTGRAGVPDVDAVREQVRAELQAEREALLRVTPNVTEAEDAIAEALDQSGIADAKALAKGLTSAIRMAVIDAVRYPKAR